MLISASRFQRGRTWTLSGGRLDRVQQSTMGDGAAARSAVVEAVSVGAEAVSEEEAPVEIGNRLELTAEEQEQITLAVQTAERRTKAEIVPMIVRQLWAVS